MDKKGFIIKVEAAIFVITFIVIAVIGILKGKVVEGSVAEEIAKWVVMDIGMSAFICALLFWPVRVWADRRYKDK